MTQPTEDPVARADSEYESWFAQPDNPDQPDETFLDDDRYLDAEEPGDPFMDAEVDPEVDGHPGFSSTQWGPDTDPGSFDPREYVEDRFSYYPDDAWREAAARHPGDDPVTYGNPDVPDRTAVEAVPDTASFDALDAWWAEIGRSGDAGAANDYARDFQDTADHVAATDPADPDPPGDDR